MHEARAGGAPAPIACVLECTRVDPETHKRYLEYRDRHAYFGGTGAILSMQDFATAEREYDALEAKGERRDDEEEARWAELTKLLFRD
jgi:hypothetical protein